jgi:hypothetical protein
MQTAVLRGSARRPAFGEQHGSEGSPRRARRGRVCPTAVAQSSSQGIDIVARLPVRAVAVLQGGVADCRISRPSLDNACSRLDLLGCDRRRAGHDAVAEQPPDFGVGEAQHVGQHLLGVLA